MATTGTITATTKRAGVGLARPFTATSLTPADATVSPTSGTTASDGTVTLTVTAVAAGTAAVRFTADGISADCVVTVTGSSTLGKLVAAGDSIMGGYKSDGATDLNLPQTSYSAVAGRSEGLTTTDTTQYDNVAIAGQTAVQVRDNTSAASRYDASRGRNVLIVGAGVNDLNAQLGGGGSADPAVVLAALNTFCTARRAQGYVVLVVQLLPNLAFNTGVQPALSDATDALNALLVAHAPEFADGLVVWPTGVAARSNSSDTTKYCADGIHPLAAYHSGTLAPIVKTAIDAALAGGYYTGVAATIDAVTITSPASGATPAGGATVAVTANVTLAGSAVTGATTSVIITAGTGATVSGMNLVGTSGGGSVTFTVRAVKGGTTLDSAPRTVTFAASGGGSTLASRLADLVTALGGDANVAGIYHTGITGAVTNDGDGFASSIADARGASGFGPALVATGTSRPTWNSTTKLLGGDVGGRGLRSAAGFSGFRLTAATTIASVFELAAGTETGFLCGLAAADGSTGGGYNTINLSGGVINGQTPSGTVTSGVATSTTRRLAISAIDGAGASHATVPNHATVDNATNGLGTTASPALKWFGYANGNSITALGNFLVVTKSALTSGQITALRDFCIADCGAVAA